MPFVDKEAEVEKEMGHVTSKPKIDIRLSDLKLVLGPELRIVYPLILNFAVSGELELNGLAHPEWIKPRGILTFENGDVNLVATQVKSCLLMWLLMIFFSCWISIRAFNFLREDNSGSDFLI